MSIPHDQSAECHHLGQTTRKAKPAELSAAPTLPHQRQGDRSSGDDPYLFHLPHFVRFRNLREAGIVVSWEQLSQLIDRYGFPPGRLLSPNTRVWDLDEVRKWLSNRPSERKVIAPPSRSRESETA
jgi:hypothetical protein